MTILERTIPSARLAGAEKDHHVAIEEATMPVRPTLAG